MRKIFITLCILIFSSNIAGANYVPIPNELRQQYKTEIEQIINNEYTQAIINVKNIINEAKHLYKNIIKNGYNEEDYILLSLIPETSLPAADIDMFVKMVKITQEKYLNHPYSTVPMDSSYDLENFLYQYFIDNDINTKKIIKLNSYTGKKIKLVKKYIKQVEKSRGIDNL